MNILDDKTSIMKDPEMGIKFIIYEKAEIKKNGYEAKLVFDES